MTPYAEKRAGEGPEGHGGEFLTQNMVVTAGQFDRPYMSYLNSNVNRRGIFPQVRGPTFQRLGRNDLAVTHNIDHPRMQSDAARRLPVHSVFNGDGAEEVAMFPDDPELQIAALMDRFRFAGLAYDAISPTKYDDTQTSESVGLQQAGTATLMAVRDVYPGALIFLRLPRPDERILRKSRDDPGTVKLIPDIRTPETTWTQVSASVMRYIFDLTDAPETRNDKQLRRIDPARNAYEAFADAAIMFGLEFLKLHVDNRVLRVSHPARGDVEDHFSFRAAGARDDPIEGDTVFYGLAKAYGIVPPETHVPGVEITLRRKQAFHRLRKVMAGMAMFDGKVRQHAFHAGLDGVEPAMSLLPRRRSPAHYMTQAQIDAPRNLVSCIDDLLSAANKWTVGVAIRGAKKEFPFRIDLK
jgi:hypothetical protein